LETARHQVDLTRLAYVARALDVPLTDLLPDAIAPEDPWTRIEQALQQAATHLTAADREVLLAAIRLRWIP
jgi:transcriptional regulator with XRE-family HTH domain